MYDIQTIKDHLESKFKLPEEQIESMVPSFIDALKDHMENLEAALVDTNLELLGKTGHTIKGAFLNLGLDECAEIASKIEKGGRAGDATENYEALVRQLEVNLKSIL